MKTYPAHVKVSDLPLENDEDKVKYLQFIALSN